MSEPASENNDDDLNEGESHRDSNDGDSRHRDGERRRRRRRKRPKPTSGVSFVAFAAMLLIFGAGLYFAIGSRVIRKLKATIQQTELPASVVHLNWTSIMITNSTSVDWGYTTVTVNDQYEAHCSDIPKGTRFEIRLQDFRGPQGRFEPTNTHVKTVKVGPEGQPVIIWNRPLQ